MMLPTESAELTKVVRSLNYRRSWGWRR